MDRIEVFKAVMEECDKHPIHCTNCLFFDELECVVECLPSQWDVEKIEQALAEMEKEK